ncbi:hypothetical protein HY733_03790 [Candidatus Uhrbacteria bacterium]|nr:hypothetical protein [Candidatus Uhrbacteria bacterium]
MWISRSEDPTDIALEKATQAYKKFRKPLLVEDSGFFIDALGGFPMTHVKFSLKTLGIEGILRAMRGTKNRNCEWHMTLAYVWDRPEASSGAPSNDVRLLAPVRSKVIERKKYKDAF